MSGIGAQRGDLLQRNVEFHLQVSDLLERDGYGSTLSRWAWGSILFDPYPGTASGDADFDHDDALMYEERLIECAKRDAITACFDEEGQHMLEGSSEPTVCVVFSPKKADEVKRAVRVIERFIAFNTAPFELVEELQDWEKKEHAGSDSNRGEPSLRAA
jgi:hypothetical protein